MEGARQNAHFVAVLQRGASIVERNTKITAGIKQLLPIFCAESKIHKAAAF